MGYLCFFVDLPEDRRTVLRLCLHRKPRSDQRSEAPVRVFYFAGECQFRARKNAAGSVEIGDRSEASGEVPKSLVTSLSPIFGGRVCTLCKL